MKKYSFSLLVLALFLPLHAGTVSAMINLKPTVEEKREVEFDRRDFLSQARNLSVDRRDRLSEERYDRCLACMDLKGQDQYHRLELKLKH